jgi:hypothetical protein
MLVAVDSGVLLLLLLLFLFLPLSLSVVLSFELPNVVRLSCVLV